MRHRGLGPRRTRRAVRLLAAAFVFVSVVAAPAGEARGVARQALPDGTAVREENSFLIYKIVGGAKVWFVNAAEFSALGYTLDRVVVVPRGALASVPDVPRDGTLVRERSSFAVHLIDGGKRRWISSREVFDAAGFTLDRVQVVANGALGGIPAGDDFRATPLEIGASAAGVKCDPTAMPFGHARARRADGNVAAIPDEGWRTYYVSVESLLYRCGGTGTGVVLQVVHRQVGVRGLERAGGQARLDQPQPAAVAADHRRMPDQSAKRSRLPATSRLMRGWLL